MTLHATTTNPYSPATGQHVLVADDDPVTALVLTLLLETLGCTVTHVEDGARAVDTIATSAPFDLVLMDCRMPELDGFAATRVLRQQGYDLPVIGCTGLMGREDVEACLAAGMDAVLHKPVRRRQLQHLLAPAR